MGPQTYVVYLFPFEISLSESFINVLIYFLDRTGPLKLHLTKCKTTFDKMYFFCNVFSVRETAHQKIDVVL